MSIFEKISGTYEILGKLGEGAGGIIYKAYHKRLRKEVVLKKMKGKSVSSAINRQEVDILKNLNHSFLPQVLDFISMDGEVYTVMSYVPGKSFQQLMDEGYQFTQNQLIHWGMQLLSALNYLHSQNPPIIHSDIKPSNIMLTPEGNVCLIDFNISFFLDGDTVLGYTTGYTSPEQYIIAMDTKSATSIPRHQKIDEKSDIYSVGATLYYLATGIRKDNYKDPIYKDLLVSKTGEAFAEVIIRAMQMNPAQRFESAFEMFKAVQGVNQKDVRYQTLLKRQKGTRIGIVLFMAFFIVLFGFGVHEMRLERVDKYNGIVEDQVEYIEEQEYEKAEEMYEEAKDLMPDALESYYQNALNLYQQREYNECISFVDYDILHNEKIDQSQHRMADVLYLKADSYFQLEEYEEAVEVYEKVMTYGTLEHIHYRDYAIALAYAGDTDKAEEVLEQAIEYGIEEDSIYYAKGEIEKALSNNKVAINDFEHCIACTSDNELKSRAYVLISKLYEQADQRNMEREVLLRAEQELPDSNQLLILERLIQADIDLANDSGNETYIYEAIEKLKKVIDLGWDTYTTYNNLSILYEQLGDLNQAEKILMGMVEKYGEDHNIYKRLAFLEIDRQELLDNYSRNYSRFAQYYEMAKSLYRPENNDTDMEMSLLENVYYQVKSGGWLN